MPKTRLGYPSAEYRAASGPVGLPVEETAGHRESAAQVFMCGQQGKSWRRAGALSNGPTTCRPDATSDCSGVVTRGTGALPPGEQPRYPNIGELNWKKNFVT